MQSPSKDGLDSGYVLRDVTCVVDPGKAERLD